MNDVEQRLNTFRYVTLKQEFRRTECKFHQFLSIDLNLKQNLSFLHNLIASHKIV